MPGTSKSTNTQTIDELQRQIIELEASASADRFERRYRALVAALDHEEALPKRRGRPKRTRNAFARHVAGSARPRGRPATLDEEWYRQTLQVFENTKRKHGLAGRGSDKRAAEEIAKRLFREVGWSVTRYRERFNKEVRYLQNLLSKARSFVTKNSQ